MRATYPEGVTRRLLLLLGLAAAVYGGWLIHHEGAINSACNNNVIDPKGGLSVSSQCLNIVWPYSEGFILLVGGAVCTLASIIWSRRVMAGERRYMKDLKSGKFSRENDHLNSYNFTLQKSPVKSGNDWRREPRGTDNESKPDL